MRGSYSWQDGLKQSLVGGGIMPDLTVDVMDKPRKMIQSDDNGDRKGKMTNSNICVQDVKLSTKNLESASTVESIEKLPETPVMHNIHGRGHEAVRPKKFWTGSNVDGCDSSMDNGGSEESLYDEETVGLSDQSQVPSQRPKQYYFPHTPQHNSFIDRSPKLSPFHQQTTLQAATPRAGGDGETAMVPTPPRDRQATLQITPRISRTVIPAMSRLKSQMSGKFNLQEYSYTPVRSGGAHDAAASGSAEDSSGMAVKNATVATRNDTKLRSILNSTNPACRSPRLSSLGSDRSGGGQAIPEFSLWKKQWPGNDARKQNHKPPLNFTSALLNNSPTATLGSEAAVSLKATSSSNSLLSPEQSLYHLGDNFYQFSGEQCVSSSASSSRPLNPYATHAAPPPQQHHHVLTPASAGEGGGGDSIFSSTSNIMRATLENSSSFFALPPSGDGVSKKPLQQQNIPTTSNGGSGSSRNGLDVCINRDSNVQHQEMISHLLPDVSNGTNAECPSPNNRLSWASFLNKHQAAQDDLESSSTYSQRPTYHHHTESEDLVKSRRLGKFDDALPWIDTDAAKTRKSKSISCIDKRSLFLDRSNNGFGSPITSLPEMLQCNQTTTNSVMNEAVGVHPETTENQRKVRSSTAGFRGRSNERQKMNARRRISSDATSKFQEVTTSHSLTSEHRRINSHSLYVKSEHHPHRSQHAHPTSQLMKSHYLESLSPFSVNTGSEPEEEVVTMRWKRGELLGEGRFGKVFLGLDEETGVLFAVKEIVLVDGTDDEVAVLQSEINTMKHLSHPNIVSYVGMECTDYSMFIFLEYVVGGSIASMLQQFGVFKEDLIRRFTQQIIQGVSYLHSYRIIHRDIKGGNVLVTGQGVAKLADFGCSKQLQGMHTQNVEDSSHAIRGSVPWMAPEVIKQTGHGRSADIWSVGATVIEMASASHPWPAFSNNLAALFHVATASEPPPIPDELSEDAKMFLQCCLCINPEDRWKADELAHHVFLSEDRKGCGDGDTTTTS